ncbi:pyridoxamine 5'-phosphate oxidase family protein [Sinosporangium album]|nr:pyridoxamine 5'-phosphate oxidase family protein [Sinosporangium album]
MATWQQFEGEAPAFAARLRTLMEAHRHKTMATLRKDGSPRISGSEAQFKDGDLWIGSMPGAVKALDLKRDPRVALHSGSPDPDDENPAAWPGDAKLSGRAIEITDPDVLDRFNLPQGRESHLFRIEIEEAVITRVAETGDMLVIEIWHEGKGLREVRRR